MPDFLTVAVLWASFLSGYPLPAPGDLPATFPKPHSFFVEHQCGGKESRKHPCNYVGAYLFQTKTIYVDETLSDVEYDQVLVHEAVHWLQDKNGKHFGYNMSCAEIVAREREAYAVEQRFITEIQHLKNKVPNMSDEEICP